MNEQKYNKYIIEKVERVNIRYYLIKVHERYYIIDYSNPAKLRNYFLGSFSNITEEWNIYDVTENKNQFPVKQSTWFSRNITLIGTSIFIFFVFNGMLFPQSMNVSVLTKDAGISQHWLAITLTVFLGALLIILFLNIINKPKIEFEKNKVYILTQVDNDKKNSKILVGIIFFILSVFFLLLLGIAGANYGSLFIFSFFGMYMLLFNRFLTFTLNKNSRKYHIVKYE